MPSKNDETERFPDPMPLLPLKDVVVFPRMVVPLLVGRATSIAAVEEGLASDRPIFLCAQRDAQVDMPGRDDLHDVGVVASILQTLRMPDGTMKIVVEGQVRVAMGRVTKRGSYAEATVTPIKMKQPGEDEKEALMRMALGQFEEYVRASQRVTPEIIGVLRGVTECDVLADLMCAHLPLRFEERQELLEMENAGECLEKLSSILMRENELLEIERRVRDRVREQMERSQREYYLHEQLRLIHQELGETPDTLDEFAELRGQIGQARMPKEVREKALRELGRYERMPSMSPEGAVVRTYLEWLVEMPWHKRTRDSLDLDLAQKVLDEDHYGLAKVKERILEFLAVHKLSKRARGPILCLVGPPGVGKTSLGQSIARAMKRKFVRVSLGGVRDEAEIRGHRRTYIGSMPGRIIQSIKRVGVKNPVFMLDEVDKMSMDFRGDPSSALLEVLDPEQNSQFSDHYLEVDFDLREVFFITTANNEYDVPPALHDRMEVVPISGYSSYEKDRIARLFLIPKQREENGLSAKDIDFKDDAIRTIIQRYTREAGVRELERRIAQVCRKVARTVITDKKRRRKTVVDGAKVSTLLGPPEYSDTWVERKPRAGVAVGLAWTMAGGDILNIETSIMKGKGDLTLTGQLGDVMRESAQAARTYLRAHASALKVSSDSCRNKDVHVHVPEGAIPKDGPSAGVPIAVSMLSALRNKPPKSLIAMTGEITLSGRVLPVGGIKEKVLAAHRAGIGRVLLPKENEKDLVEIPKEVKKETEFVLVSTIDEAFHAAFDPRRRS